MLASLADGWSSGSAVHGGEAPGSALRDAASLPTLYRARGPKPCFRITLACNLWDMLHSSKLPLFLVPGEFPFFLYSPSINLMFSNNLIVFSILVLGMQGGGIKILLP